MIVDANISGQGYDKDHTANAAHLDILACGYEYSHSVPVVHFDNKRLLHHCYKHGRHNVAVWTVGYGVFATVNWNASTSCSSGRSMRGYDVLSLRAHLKSKARRYKELRIQKGAQA